MSNGNQAENLIQHVMLAGVLIVIWYFLSNMDVTGEAEILVYYVSVVSFLGGIGSLVYCYQISSYDVNVSLVLDLQQSPREKCTIAGWDYYLSYRYHFETAIPREKKCTIAGGSNSYI